ncbi:MAG TPA: pyridoxal-dependent decarboxylase [Thermoanaerobaculia bacterium]
MVAGGTIANISALLIARNAVFDYLLGWEGASQTLGPAAAWEAVREIWKYERMVVLTSLGAHYSVRKSAMQAGISPANVIEIPGSSNPWRLDGAAFKAYVAKPKFRNSGDLVIAVVPIAGKTETGYVDDLKGIAIALNDLAKEKHDWKTPSAVALPDYPTVLKRVSQNRKAIEKVITGQLSDSKEALQSFSAIVDDAKKDNSDAKEMEARARSGKNEIENARHNRLFLHVDAAHGGGYLTVPALREKEFAGIELADTITIDGHKSLYCYYPCGGLLIRTTRWARTLASGQSDYISEETNYEAYPESAAFFDDLRAGTPNPHDKLLPSALTIQQRKMYALVGMQALAGRSLPATRSELTHQPYNQYLEGSRGPQGIMQLYFNLATLGLRGYRSILEWTCLLSRRLEEAISLGMTDLRLVTDDPMLDPQDSADGNRLCATDKMSAISSSNSPESAPLTWDGRLVMPVGGGRFLRLSDGSCNQTLLAYIPAREAKLIVSEDKKYWTDPSDEKGISRMRYTLAFLWRVNEHLWHEHVYANPNFTYYLGHTALEMKLPASKTTPASELARLLESWNVWLRRPRAKGYEANPFLTALAEDVAAEELRKKEKSPAPRPVQTAIKFFCHKVIVMHPYTDESLLGDMLRRVAFWGERSVADVRIADSIGSFIGERKRNDAKT